MKELIIVLPQGEHNLSSVTGPYEIFRKANAYWKKRHGAERFRIRLAGASETVSLQDGLFAITPHLSLDEVAYADLIIIPSLNHNYQLAAAGNEALTDWLRTQYKAGSEIAAICTGAFLLAATGLLNGKTCSTHWSAAIAFREMFPAVNLLPDKLITDEQGLYTNGGAYSFLNLVVYLVEKHYDRETAIYCTKVFQIEPDRNAQSEFSLFTGQKAHDDEVVQQAQAYIEQHLEEKISISDLSARFHVGRRNFDRRFVRATGNTPLEYAQRVKIEVAKKAFETNRKSISQVMFEVGYNDVKAFREVFRRITGMSPAAYKARYARISL